MNDFSHLIGSLLFKHRIDASGEFSGHRHDRFSRRPIARVALVNRAVELPKFRVLSDGRPSRLDQFTAKPPVPTARDVPARHSIPSRALSGHQTDEPRQLAHITDLLRIADTSQKVAGHDLANPRNAFEMSHRLAKLWVLLIEAANLFDRLNHPLLGRLQAFHELIKLKAHRRRARNFFQFSSHNERPLAARRSWGKLKPLQQQQGFNAKLGGHEVLDKGIPELNELAQLAVGFATARARSSIARL